MNVEALKPVVEAILMAAEEPVSLDRLGKLVESDAPVGREALREALAGLAADYDGRGIELAEVASGWRFRVRSSYAEHVGRLFEERRPRYSRAFMETLAIIAYRQPITRGEIEHIRGVAVSTGIMRQLLEREWVRVVGHRDVPGRPSVYATTHEFLDYFGLRSLDELPTLAELKDIGDLNTDLFADAPTIAALPARGEVDGDADGTAAGETRADGAVTPDEEHGEQAAERSDASADADAEPDADDDSDAPADRPAATG